MDSIEAKNRVVIGKIYADVRSELYAIFRQACIAEEECEDLVQEVFVKILGLDIIIEEQLKGLAVTIAYQKRTDYLRHRAYINKVKMDSRGWEMEQSYTNTEAEVNDILNMEIDSQTYCLSRFEDKTADEIALQLNLSKRAVESRLYRTRMTMRKTLKHAINY